jgi:hypothetical protein
LVPAAVSVTSELDGLYDHRANTIIRPMAHGIGNLFARDGSDDAELTAVAIAGNIQAST